MLRNCKVNPAYVKIHHHYNVMIVYKVMHSEKYSIESRQRQKFQMSNISNIFIINDL